MTEPIKAYPLKWPEGWKRVESWRRKAGAFNHSGKELTINQATLRVRESLEKMRVRDDDIVISSNLVLRLDGNPRSDQRAPEDPGVAVYWQTKAGQRCIAIDQYTKVAGNLAAIAATLEAMRAIERHGGAEILDRAFTGFVALEGPAPIDWRDVLGYSTYDPTREDLEKQYRAMRSTAHPDRGGSPQAFDRVQRAYEAACKELGYV